MSKTPKNHPQTMATIIFSICTVTQHVTSDWATRLKITMADNLIPLMNITPL
jgi:hypothetical protein